MEMMENVVMQGVVIMEVVMMLYSGESIYGDNDGVGFLLLPSKLITF